MTTRRTFISQSSAVMAGLAVRRSLPRGPEAGAHTRTLDPAIRIDSDPLVKTLAMRALDAAKSAGASYADVRLTRTLVQNMAIRSRHERTRQSGTSTESYGVGVRALVNGCWGFAASPNWTLDEVAQLGAIAATQAKMNASGLIKPVELGNIPVVTGSWRTPVKIDPFTVPLEEREEFCSAAVDLGRQLYLSGARPLKSSASWWRLDRQGTYGDPVPNFWRQERAVATSEGSYVTQTLYESAAAYGLYIEDPSIRSATSPGFPSNGVTGLGRQAAGWEMFLDANISAQLPRVGETLAEDLKTRLGRRTGAPGRYDVVFDAQSMADLIRGTIAEATQLDVALGYEANAGGQSYLHDPLGMLGQLNYQTPLLNITANRSMPGGLATVGWDDECVVPEAFPLIKDGILVDYQTTREQTAWLASYYQKAGLPMRSHGCAGADSALSVTMQHVPNIVMTPGAQDTGFEDLIKDTKRGIAVMRATVNMDWQGRNGIGSTNSLADSKSYMREIVDGKLGPRIYNLNFRINTLEFWKGLVGVGGSGATLLRQYDQAKGEPSQATSYTISAVPAKITDVSFSIAG